MKPYIVVHRMSSLDGRSLKEGTRRDLAAVYDRLEARPSSRCSLVRVYLILRMHQRQTVRH